jgi:hypothetical protein
MKKPHDPYTPLLAELRETNEADTDELLRESLRKTRPFVSGLRESYRKCPSNVDYSSANNRAAYLLAYYPHHIETLYRLLAEASKEVEEILINFFDQPKLRACFLGAGPAPEVISWLAYLSEYVPQVQRVTAYLLDKHIEGWHKGQEITRYHLAPMYWPNGKLVTIPMEFDLLNAQASWNDRIDRAFKISSFFVMQNCLNDQLTTPAKLMDNLIWLFKQMCPVSLFVIIDLNFQQVLNFMIEFEKRIANDKLGVVFRGAASGIVEFESLIETPRIICEELLTGETNLIPRQHTKFYGTVMARIDAHISQPHEDEIPF